MLLFFSIYNPLNSGSYAKHTAINIKFDLDLLTPFKRDSFDTLENMFDDVYAFIYDKYNTSAKIRKQKVSIGIEFYPDNDGDVISIDIVPGRELNKNQYEKDKKLNLYVNFNYALRSTFEDAPEYANRFSIKRYNVVTAENENLENELYHSARLVYTKFRLNKGMTMAGSISFNKKIRSIRNQVLLQGINQSSQAFSANNPETTWNFSTNMRKKTGKFTTKLRANFRFSDYLQIINDQTLKNKVSAQNFGVEAATNFSNWPNITMGYNREFGQFSSANTTSDYSNENPYINLEYNFLKDFTLLADYSRNNNRTYTGQKNRYELVNASLFYQKEDSPWGFEISATNVLNTIAKRQNTVSDYLISDHIIYILPRIIMFKISYKL